MFYTNTCSPVKGELSLHCRNGGLQRPTHPVIFGLDKVNAPQVAPRDALLPTRSDECPQLTVLTLSAANPPNRRTPLWSSCGSFPTTKRASFTCGARAT